MTRPQLVIAVLVAGAAGLGGLALALRQPVVVERLVAGRPIQVPEAGYVSSQTCRACHPGQYASWHRSYHRTMTQLATPETIAASFDSVTVDAVAGAPMLLQQRGRELWAEFDDPDVEGQTGEGPGTDRGLTPVRPRRIKRQVVMTTGSHNQQIYWYATGNSRVLGQLPAIWLTADRRWIPRRAAVMRPPGGSHMSETGAWNGVCLACHTTNGQPHLDAPFGSKPILTQAADTRATEFGVACESCHGPAAQHTRANRNPLRRYAVHLTGRPDPTIVQPLRLSPARSSQVCGQCHSFWEFADAQDERSANSGGLPYRPGDNLAATRFIVQPTQNLQSATMQAFLQSDAGFIRDIFWSDGMVRATGREYNGLIESPCFKNATVEARTMSCFSCHTMHQTADDTRQTGEWADDQLAPVGLGNGACLQCHAPSRGRGPERAAPQQIDGAAPQQIDEAAPQRIDGAAPQQIDEAAPQRIGGAAPQRIDGAAPQRIDGAAPQRIGGTAPQDIEAHTHHRAGSAGSSCYNCHMPFTTYGLLKTIRSHQISSPSVQSTLDTGRPNACNLCHLDQTLAWSARYLEKWYGVTAPPLDSDQASVAASLLSLLKGDAGQRAIVAQSMGWTPAQQASGTGWLTPYLALTAKDSYDAVRYIAARSQRTLPPFRRDQLPRGNPQLLINPDGTFNAEVVNRLVRARDNRRVFYRE